MKYFLPFGFTSLLLIFWGCGNSTDTSARLEELLLNDPTICRTPQSLLASIGSFEEEKIVKLNYPGMVYADDPSDFPKIQANYNLRPAGHLKDQILNIELEASPIFA